MKVVSARIVHDNFVKGKNPYNLPSGSAIESIWVEAMITKMDRNRNRMHELINLKAPESGSGYSTNDLIDNINKWRSNLKVGNEVLFPE